MELETMIDNVIRKYGFESERTIAFCKTVEDYKENPKPFKLTMINAIYNEIMR